MAGKHGRKLRFSDRWQAWWFLLNASLIHLFLDGFVGLFQQIPALADEYDVLDKVRVVCVLFGDVPVDLCDV